MTQIQGLLVLTFLAVWSSVWAQAPVASPGAPPVAPPGAPPPVEGWSGTLILGLTALGLLVILGVVAKLYDLRRQREANAIGLQSRLSDALLTDRTLPGATVTPTVRAPMWKRSPLTIEVSGDVPSADLRDAVLRVVRREASQVRADVEVEDKLLIMPPRIARAA